MFEEIYQEYLLHKNEENRKKRYDGKESWYHASGAGFCSRKLYYQSVEKAKPTNPSKKANMRIMRMGTLIHKDFEEALIYYNNINNNNINKEYFNTVNIAEQSAKEFAVERIENIVTEEEIKLPEFNVRGFYDVLLQTSSADNQKANRLYDVKTISNWGFRQKFKPTKGFSSENRNHFLQIGTYGLAVKEKYGSLDSMGIIYYNKDNSSMHSQSVPMKYLDTARRYWFSIKEEHDKGLPPFQLGVSPAYFWCCEKYCEFKDHCNPPNFKRNKEIR
tara:strand:+ start:1256 stop:2080 length:825 start_codon:yes stop_codon:yes gene_type:complete